MNYTPTFLASGYGFTNFHAVQWEVRHVLGTCWLTSVSHCRPGQRTGDDLEIIYDELLHIKALAHLSNTVSQLVHFSFKGTVHIYTVSKTTFICPKPLATKQIYLFLPAQFFPPHRIYIFLCTLVCRWRGNWRALWSLNRMQKLELCVSLHLSTLSLNASECIVHIRLFFFKFSDFDLWYNHVHQVFKGM